MELVGGALSQMVGCVERFGGTVKDLAGDGVLALFGAPVAHEDDPEEAVRAGLDIVETICAYAGGSPRLRGGERLSFRICIDSGVVPVGLVGGDRRVELGGMDDAVNTAARLQAEAEPGTVLVGAGTFERVQNLFEWDGPRSLSPMATNVEDNTTRRERLRRTILIAGALAVVSFLIEEIADLEHRAVGDVLGPVLFIVFVASVLTVVVLSVYLLTTKVRPRA